MGLAWPLALVGLLSLAIPLGIHLLQRGGHNTVEIATTRFVPQEERPQWRWTRLREPWLWLLRTLLLLAAVILLAEPYGQRSPDPAEGETVTLVSPRVAADIARALADEQDTLRWLAPGFKDLSTPAPDWHSGQLWGDLWQADQTLSPSLQFRVIAPPLGGELGATRPALGRSVEWIDAPAPPAAAASATELFIVHDADRGDDARHLLGIAELWRQAGLPVNPTLATPTSVPPQTANVIWLSDSPWSEHLSMQRSGVIVSDSASSDVAAHVVQRRTQSQQGRPLVLESSDDARIVRRFTIALEKHNEEVRNPEFALTLAQIALTRFVAPVIDDLRVADALTSPRQHTAGVADLRRSKASIWVWIVLVLAAFERLVAGSQWRTT